MKTKTGYAEFKADVAALARAVWEKAWPPLLGLAFAALIVAAVWLIAVAIPSGVKGIHDRAHQTDRDTLESLADTVAVQTVELHMLEQRVAQSEPLIDWSSGSGSTVNVITNTYLYMWSGEDAR